ncbi:MAG: alginate export family protein [Candidatus Mariimomonas ferrooxydans]
MKKYLVVFLSMLLVLSFSMSASALHETSGTEYNPGMVTKKGVQIKLSGSIRTRGELKVNTLDFDSDSGDNYSAFDTRVRLKFNARAGSATRAVVELESGSGGSDYYEWGADIESGVKGGYKKSNSKRGSMDIRQAYAAHQFHPTGDKNYNVGLKVGHMLLALGNGLFYDHTKYGDDAVIVWTDLGKGEIAFSYVKFEENSSTISDDANAYILTLQYPLDNVNISADVTFFDDQDFNSAGDTDGLHFWNFGLRSHTNMSGITLRGDVELQTGSVDNCAPLTAAGCTAGGSEQDFSGYAFLVGADYKVGDVKLTAEVAFGSGDDNPGDNDNEAFLTTVGDDQHYTYVYEYRAKTATGEIGTGLSNTWYINVSASTKATHKIKLKGDIYYLQASENVSINGGEPDSDIGWEIDGKFEYKIAKNLVYYVEGGYLVVGDAYDFASESADNTYAIRNGLVVKF